MRGGGILALDLSKSGTGWAYGHPAVLRSRSAIELAIAHGDRAVPLSGSKPMGTAADSMGRVFCAFSDWLADSITTFSPGVLVFEAPLPGGRQSSINAGRLLIGLASVAELIAERRGLRVYEVAVSTVRKHFCGDGRATKDDVMAECRRRAWEPVDHNAGDALAALDYSIACLTPRGKVAA